VRARVTCRDNHRRFAGVAALTLGRRVGQTLLMGRRIVVATPDVLGPAMAGPAIRALQFAKALGAEHEVELVSTTGCTRTGDSFPVRQVTSAEVDELITRTDVWVVQGNVLQVLPQIAASSARVVVDLYAPYHLESLEPTGSRTPRERLAASHNATVALNGGMVRGDFFLTASDKQRDFWLGALASLGRVNPLTYDTDRSLRSLVAVVPFGVEDQPPVHSRPALRGVTPGIGPDDRLLLWGGGVYNWFDPLTLVRAVEQLTPTHPDLRLVFLGGKHPNPAVIEMRMAVELRALSDQLGLTGKHVFFNEGWVPYDERGSFFLEADIGVSTHLDHVETAFSFRTRILDYLWARLPVVSTDGDVFAEVLEHSGAGITVPPGDVPALVAALGALLDDPERRQAAARASAALAEDYRWDVVVQPLLDFCRTGERAPDLLDRTASAHRERPFEPVRAPTPGPAGWRGEVALARQYVQQGGVGLLLRRVVTRAGKLLRGRSW
jgi:glycosyltransferase involved in cell wall biosynthesis